MEKIWLNKYNKETNPEIDFHSVELSLPKVLEDSVKQYSDNLAIKFNDKILTYKEFGRLTAVIAGNLKLFGLDRQDKVCVLLPNLPETILAFWSIERAGLVAVMTNPAYSERELLHQINDSDSKVIITTDSLAHKISGLMNHTPLRYAFIVNTSNEEVVYNSEMLPWDELLVENMGYFCDNIKPEDDLAALQYTGGTTGISKGCMLTHFNVASNAYMLKEQFKTLLNEGNERFVGVLPYFHVYGLQLTVLYPVLIGAVMLPLMRFTAHSLLSLLMAEKITAMASAPSIFSACLAQKDIDNYDISSVKLVISGSAPLPVALLKNFEDRTGAVIVEGYGLSEASPVTHLSPIESEKRKFGSIGLPLVSTDAKIVDVEYGIKELDVGKNGELCIRGPQVMKGYYKNVAATKEVLTDGWLHTGDIAYCDEDGYFFITDRKKDLIICGGFNVYPREVEEVLYQHPLIAEACVVGVNNDLRGEDVKAFIVKNPGANLTEKDIAAFCRERLANYKVPRHIEFMDALPKSSVGKILRRELRERK